MSIKFTLQKLTKYLLSCPFQIPVTSWQRCSGIHFCNPKVLKSPNFCFIVCIVSWSYIIKILSTVAIIYQDYVMSYLQHKHEPNVELWVGILGVFLCIALQLLHLEGHLVLDWLVKLVMTAILFLRSLLQPIGARKLIGLSSKIVLLPKWD